MERESFVPYGTRAGYLLHGIPGPLQKALAKAAKKRDTSLTNIIGEVLAERYQLPFEPSGRPLKSDFVGSPTFFVKLPSTVIDAVRDEARARDISMRSVFLLALSESFGLEPPPLTKINPPRRRSKHGRPRGRKGAVT